MTDIVALIARAQNAYVRCIDNGQIEAWPDFFEDNCLYKITTADNHSRGLEAGVIFANSKGMLRDRIASLREANIYERHAYRHFLGEVLLALPAVRETRTYAVMEEVKTDGALPL